MMKLRAVIKMKWLCESNAAPRRGERGMTLLEIVCSLVLLGVSAVVFFQALSYGQARHSDVMIRAHALEVVRSEMEWWRGMMSMQVQGKPVPALYAEMRKREIALDSVNHRKLQVIPSVTRQIRDRDTYYQIVKVAATFPRIDGEDTLSLESRFYAR